MRPTQTKRVIRELSALGYLVRVKHLRAVTDLKGNEYLMTAHFAKEQGAQIHARGGETHAAVYMIPDGVDPKDKGSWVRLAHAVAHCNDAHENFRTDLGTAVALGRAVRKLHEAGVAREVKF